MSTNVRFVDKNPNAIKERKRLAQRPFVVKVGIQGTEATKRTVKGVSVLEIAVFNEFGTRTIPARPFVGGWYDANEAEAYQKIKKGMQNVIALKITTETLAEAVGIWASAGIQAFIANGVPPANAASTVRRKGSSMPLIDTGVLRASITYTTSIEALVTQ